MKKQNGISLIVLVITIIVLSILAATVIVSLSNTNIIGEASNAVGDTEVQTERELVVFAISSSMSKNKGVIDVNDIQESLENAVVKVEGDTITVQFNSSNKKYIMDKDGYVTETAAKGEWKNNEDGTFSIEKDGKKVTVAIGDTVEYNVVGDNESLSYTSLKSKNGYEDQTFTASNYTGKWQVFGEENGHLLLISDVITPDGKTHYGLYGEQGYLNSEEEFKNIASIYGKGKNVITARCITLEDVNNITKYPIENHNAGAIYAYGNTVTYEKTESGFKYYYTKDGNVIVGECNNNVNDASTVFYYFGNNEYKKLDKVGEKVEITANYCSYDITKYTNDTNVKYVNMLLGKGNYWLDYRYERPINTYAIYGHLIVNDSTKEVDRNYSNLSHNIDKYGPESNGTGYYTNCGIRVLVTVDYTEPISE